MSFPPLMSVAADGLDFVLFCISHKVRGRLGVVFSMFFCFAIWGKKRGMKHRVDGPLVWKCELVCHRRYHLGDGKGAVSPQGQLHQPIQQG